MACSTHHMPTIVLYYVIIILSIIHIIELTVSAQQWHKTWLFGFGWLILIFQVE